MKVDHSGRTRAVSSWAVSTEKTADDPVEVTRERPRRSPSSTTAPQSLSREGLLDNLMPGVVVVTLVGLGLLAAALLDGLDQLHDVGRAS